jgi:myo-inositol-1-phosphate synthase
MVAAHLAVGLERMRLGELEPYGVPLANYSMPYSPTDIRVVAAYDVDDKVGKTLYSVARRLLGDEIHVPTTLKDVVVQQGIHLGSLKGMPVEASGLEDRMPLFQAVETLVEQWKEKDVDVVVNIITTEYGKAFDDPSLLEAAVVGNEKEKLTASHAYAYAATLYSEKVKPIPFINAIPTPLANDWAVVKTFENAGGLVLGDDGATGATPLTCDLLEHLAERNRKVKYAVQFNIGGNTDFLALTTPERNLMKEITKSSIVKDILGYDAPHYIKPTGYLEPLGDKKFIAMNLEYISFNGFVDELYITGRINDSPALAGNLVDLIRLSKIAVDNSYRGTVNEINSFFMKKPGPPNVKAIAKIVAYQNLIRWLEKLNAVKLPTVELQDRGLKEVEEV